MSDLESLLERLVVSGPLPVGGGSEPFGRAWLPDDRWGVDLSAAGYREDEYLISGLAETWAWDEQLRAVPTGPAEFTTRILVRRPIDPQRFSGSVQVEPHHPDADRALSWAAIGPWIVRNGHAHVGVTQEPWVLGDLAAWDSGRYGTLRISHPTHRWDIMALVVVAIRNGAIPSFADVRVDRAIMSGWSMTGTFCRTFLGEGFHERARWGSEPAVSGYVICISSGNAQRAGYNELTYGALPERDPRRTIQPHGVPIAELLSECEAETHGPVLRHDSDRPEDGYRLFEVAGTGHSSFDRPRSLSTNHRQLELHGMPVDRCRVNETPSDARMDLVARAVFQMVDEWIAHGRAPATASRFAYADPDAGGHRGVMPEAVPLQRDADGNVRHGVRTPWVEAPGAVYLPHSTPVPDGCETPSRLPGFGPRERADLVAHMLPFSPEQMAARYGTSARHRELYEQAARAAVEARWLLPEDLQELLDALGA